MRIRLIIILIILLPACKKQLPSKLYQNDKERFTMAFINNVEAIRLIKANKDKDSIPGLPYPLEDYYSDFYGLHSYHDDKADSIVVVERPTCEWMDVEVVTIHYSLDSLKCVALITVNRPNDKLYNGYAFLGVRKHKNDILKVYPMGPFEFRDFFSRSSLSNVLKRSYYNLGEGKISDYTCGINSPEFFETAPQFEYIDSLGLYKGETEKYYRKNPGQRYHKIFYSNQEETMDKNLCEN